MNIKIKRGQNIQEYEIEARVSTLLETLTYIKTNIDSTLTFRSGCRSEVCGSCAVVVNSREKLACGYKIEDGDLVEPLRRVEVIRDLVVDIDRPTQTLKKSLSYLSKNSGEKPSIEDEKRVEVQSNCILCGSCYSSCPVLDVDREFLGPFALTRVLRYVNDLREEDKKTKIDAVQQKGVWDCTLCGECSIVCPQEIDPKNDITLLRSKSVQFGYTDPTFATMDNFSFGGFNPNF